MKEQLLFKPKRYIYRVFVNNSEKSPKNVPTLKFLNFKSPKNLSNLRETKKCKKGDQILLVKFGFPIRSRIQKALTIAFNTRCYWVLRFLRKATAGSVLVKLLVVVWFLHAYTEWENDFSRAVSGPNFRTFSFLAGY